MPPTVLFPGCRLGSSLGPVLSLLTLLIPVYGVEVSSALSPNHSALGCPRSLPCDCLLTATEAPLKLINCTHRDLPRVPSFLELTGHAFDELRLQHNALTGLSKNAFQGLTLIRLDLSSNDISAVSDNAFLDLDGVLELNLSDNKLESAPVSLQHLPQLTKLVLRNNLIRQLSRSAFSKLLSLLELDLSHNPVQFASPFDAFHDLNQLQILRLESCSIPNLPLEALRNLSNLQILDAKRNNISSIPTGVFDHVPKLRELYLENNNVHLTDFHEFQALRGLKILKLSHCHLPNISATVLRSVPQLHTLVLRHCHIRHVFHGPFRNLLHLTKLDLSGNPRVRITDRLFHGVEERLRYLGIENMNLSFFPTKAVRKLFVVKKIKANRNPIRYLPEATFKGLIGNNLEIHMDKCEIFNISADFIVGVNKPIVLSLRENEISSLEFLIKQPCQYHNASLDLSDNPLECDCVAASTLQMKAFRVLGQCETPDEFRGMDLAPDIGTTVDVHHLERVALAECGLDTSLTDERYDCACQAWLPINSTVVCAGQAALDPGRLLGASLALLVLNVWHSTGT